MATYIYVTATGALYSWNPNDTDPVASASVLASNGLSKVTGLAPLDATHGWNPATLSVITIAPPTQIMGTGYWVQRFTPTEFAGVSSSTDPQVQQLMFALSRTLDINLADPNIINGVAYLVSKGLLTSARQAQIMAVPASYSGP